MTVQILTSDVQVCILCLFCLLSKSHSYPTSLLVIPFIGKLYHRLKYTKKNSVILFGLWMSYMNFTLVHISFENRYGH